MVSAGVVVVVGTMTGAAAEANAAVVADVLP